GRGVSPSRRASRKEAGAGRAVRAADAAAGSGTGSGLRPFTGWRGHTSGVGGDGVSTKGVLPGRWSANGGRPYCRRGVLDASDRKVHTGRIADCRYTEGSRARRRSTAPEARLRSVRTHFISFEPRAAHGHGIPIQRETGAGRWDCAAGRGG